MKNKTITRVIIVGVVLLISLFLFTLVFLGGSDRESAYNMTDQEGPDTSLFPEDDLQESVLEGVRDKEVEEARNPEPESEG